MNKIVVSGRKSIGYFQRRLSTFLTALFDVAVYTGLRAADLRDIGMKVFPQEWVRRP